MQPSTHSDHDPASAARSEMNLAEWPIFLVGKGKGRADDGVIVFGDRFKDPASGGTAVREVVIERSAHGYPSERDGDVLLALMALSKWQTDFATETFRFTFAELLGLLHWSDGGESHARISLALLRWHRTGMVFTRGWFDLESGKSLRHVHLTLIDRLDLPGRENRPGDRWVEVTWGKDFFRSLAAGYIRAVDLDAYLGLGSTAKPMYLYLGKQFGRRNSPVTLRFDLREFAVNKAGLTPSSNVALLKRRLDGAIEDLVAIKFLEPLPPSERYIKLGRGEWEVAFRRPVEAIEAVARPAPSRPAPAALPPPARPAGGQLALFPDLPDAERLIAMMRDRDVENRRTMLEAVRAYPERIEPMCALFDRLKGIGKKVGGRTLNGGFLISMIRDGFELNLETQRKLEEAETVRRRALATPAAPATPKGSRVEGVYRELRADPKRLAAFEERVKTRYADEWADMGRQAEGLPVKLRDSQLRVGLRDLCEKAIREGKVEPPA